MNALGRLALRALAAPAQVRPRLGGLFENPAGGSDLESPAPAVSPPAAAPAPDAGPRLGAQSTADDAPSTPLAPPPSEASPQPPVARLTNARDDEPLSPRVERPATPADAPAEAVPVRTLLDRLTARPALEAAIREAEDPTPRSTAQQPYRPLLPPLADRRAEAPVDARRSEPAAQGPADLHISIGRIEVRGEPERRAPVPAARPAPRLMSLEDYLAKGRRR